VIAATNKNLELEIEQDRFREDLYYRLNVIPFRVPALRERADDVPLLAREFLDEFCAEAGVKVKKITARAMRALERHSWPGNVRELRNLMERLVIMTPGPSIDLPNLPDSVTAPAVSGADPPTLDEARRSFEREFLVARLAEHGWNISRTAEAIGIARESLSRKIKSYGIEADKG
jgi:two-component system nitrogen regulation response regulator NtrX